MGDSGEGIIACCSWVPRGVAKEQPDKVELTQEELAGLIEATRDQLAEEEAYEAGEGDEDEEDDWEDVDEDEGEDEDQGGDEGAAAAAAAAAPAPKGRKAVAAAKRAAKMMDQSADVDDELAEYNLDTYDDDETPDGHLPGLGGLTVFASNDDDPYITNKEDDEDIEDFNVRPTDNMVVIGQTVDVYSHLEIYVYDEIEHDLFSHHDIMLSYYPLCLETFSFDPASPEGHGNLVAVGGMSPQIEVWDLDIIDCVQPAFVLGDRKRKNKKKSRGHRAEVMALSWNRLQPNLLASGSADTTVKLWDMSQPACVFTASHHKDKVQCVSWNPAQPAVLLTGSFDHTACAFDSRAPDAVSKWTFAADMEAMLWDEFSPQNFFASTEDGRVYCCDTRNPGSVVYTIDAHTSAVSAVTQSHFLPGLLVTGSNDRSIKIWDVSSGQPKHIHTRNMDVGAVYTTLFSPDSPFVVSVGGREGGLKVLDLEDIGPVRRHFAQHPRKPQTNAVERSERVYEDDGIEDGLATRQKGPGKPRVQAEFLDDDEFDSEDEESWAQILEQMHLNGGAAAAGAARPKGKKKHAASAAMGGGAAAASAPAGGKKKSKGKKKGKK